MLCWLTETFIEKAINSFNTVSGHWIQHEAVEFLKLSNLIFMHIVSTNSASTLQKKKKKSRSSVMCMLLVNRLQCWQPGKYFSIPVKGRTFFASLKHENVLRGPSCFLYCGRGDPFLGETRPEHESGHSSPSSDQFKMISLPSGVDRRYTLP
jgi:hypothetical protein